MPEFTLPRTGMPAIKFYGDQLATACGKDLPKCENRGRWHEITVYRTDSGRWLIHVAFRCSTKYDAPNDHVAIFDEPTDAITFLWEYDCTAAVQGWRNPKHSDRDEALRNELENYFDQLVNNIVTAVPKFAVSLNEKGTVTI